MKSILKRIADWHGEQAANFYVRWSRTAAESDMRDYLRHSSLAEKMWSA